MEKVRHILPRNRLPKVIRQNLRPNFRCHLRRFIKTGSICQVACETCVTTGLVLIMGEITTTGYSDIQKIARQTVERIGYNRGKYGFDAENLAV